jgi:hypothetical protein
MSHALRAFSIRFEGHVLNRGFWLYVIDIRGRQARHLYVGRTGDSSSANAASPFSRIGQHLDSRTNAKGNALARNLAKVGLEPASCDLEMIAIGPIYPEQLDFETHKPFRDRLAALEWGVAQALRQRGYSVLGTHYATVEPEASLLTEVMSLLQERLSSSPPD